MKDKINSWEDPGEFELSPSEIEGEEGELVRETYKFTDEHLDFIEKILLLAILM